MITMIWLQQYNDYNSNFNHNARAQNVWQTHVKQTENKSHNTATPYAATAYHNSIRPCKDSNLLQWAQLVNGLWWTATVTESCFYLKQEKIHISYCLIHNAAFTL